MYALFKQEPEPPEEIEEVDIEGLNSDATMVIIDGAEVAPQEDVYYRDINTNKLYTLVEGRLEETSEPEPEPQDSGPEITFTWTDDYGLEQKIDLRLIFSIAALICFVRYAFP